jgi:broad specificity phosphatase PhoE
LTALTLISHALTPALRGLVLGGAAQPDPASLEAARELKLGGFVDAFSGPEPAAVQTAEALGLVPTIDRALRDREYGEWSGQELETLLTTSPEAVAAWLERPHTAPPGGETENDVITRVADWLGDLAQPSDDPAPRRTVAAVVHPAVVRAAILYVLDAPAESLRHVDVRPLSVVQLSAHNGSWSLTFG